MAGGDAAENARIAEVVLSGEDGGHRDLVLLNAGIRIWLAERADSIGEGIDKAREAIDSGAARVKLDELKVRDRTPGPPSVITSLDFRRESGILMLSCLSPVSPPKPGTNAGDELFSHSKVSYQTQSKEMRRSLR